MQLLLIIISLIIYGPLLHSAPNCSGVFQFKKSGDLTRFKRESNTLQAGKRERATKMPPSKGADLLNRVSDYLFATADGHLGVVIAEGEGGIKLVLTRKDFSYGHLVMLPDQDAPIETFQDYNSVKNFEPHYKGLFKNLGNRSQSLFGSRKILHMYMNEREYDTSKELISYVDSNGNWGKVKRGANPVMFTIEALKEEEADLKTSHDHMSTRDPYSVKKVSIVSLPLFYQVDNSLFHPQIASGRVVPKEEWSLSSILTSYGFLPKRYRDIEGYEVGLKWYKEALFVVDLGPTTSVVSMGDLHNPGPIFTSVGELVGISSGIYIYQGRKYILGIQSQFVRSTISDLIIKD